MTSARQFGHAAGDEVLRRIAAMLRVACATTTLPRASAARFVDASRADSGLYRASRDGRNRVQVVWGAEVGGSLWLL